MLLIDIGNSRIKWVLAPPGDAPLPEPQAEDHGGEVESVIAALELPAADTVRVASVLGQAREAALTDAIRAAVGTAPQFARVQDDLHQLRVAYAEPARLGVDRWLGMLGIWQATRGAFCLAGAGTALTFDAVNDAGEHLGGFIAPGLTTAQKAVDTHTRFEIRKTFDHYSAGLGRDTESCVRQGALYSCVGAIERASRSTPGAKFITGGDAGTLLGHLPRGWEWRPNAVLDGLRVLPAVVGGDHPCSG